MTAKIECFNYIVEHYEPCEMENASMRISNIDLYAQLCKSFPTDVFDEQKLFTFLKSEGFQYKEVVNLKFVWLFKKK